MDEDQKHKSHCRLRALELASVRGDDTKTTLIVAERYYAFLMFAKDPDLLDEEHREAWTVSGELGPDITGYTIGGDLRHASPDPRASNKTVRRTAE